MGLRATIRVYLGTDRIPYLFDHLRGIEATMANEILTLLQGLASQTAELNATQQASIVNIHNGFERLSANIRDLSQQLADALASNGAVTPEMQAAADEISQALADIKKGAETADDDFEPVEPPADNGDGGDVPVDNGGGDVPVDNGGDLPTDPGTDVPADNSGDVPANPSTGDTGDDTGPVVENTRRGR
jgi:hypothetical protein